jgi:hypothetical protein
MVGTWFPHQVRDDMRGGQDEIATLRSNGLHSQ